MKKKIKILAVSDIHLGSEYCKANSLISAMLTYDFEQLIIVGDLQEDQKPPFCNAQWELVKYLCENRDKITYIEGNHDIKGKWLGKILCMEAKKKLIVKIAGKKVCFIHGHQFDKIGFVFNEPTIDWMFIRAMRIIKHLHINGYGFGYLQSCLESFHNGFSERVAQNAYKYAKHRGIKLIVCGHTHVPMRFRQKTVEYINCGAWVDDICSFVTIDEDCKTELHHVKQSTA